MQYISGEAFKNICKYNLDDRYTLIPIDSNLKENDRVFIKQSDIDALIKANPAKKVTLVVHNTDETFDDVQMDRVRQYANKVYAANSSAKDAIQMPLGFRDDQYTPHKVLDEQKNSEKRDILCLLNFSIGTGNNERSDALNAFKDYIWAVKNTNNTPGLHLEHNNNETINLRKEFYKTLNKTKFVICPFGAGKDTHRVYEALFFGAIPIIKSSFLDPMYKALGECWIVNDWSEVTEDECNKHWASRSLKPFKNNVGDWLNMSGGSNNPTISFITYGDDNFKNAKERILNEVKNIGLFNGNIKAYGPEDLSDDFVKKVGNVMNESRGGGYWIWKPYIINDMLNKLNENDILVYADSGCTLQKSGSNRLNEYINMISSSTIYSVLAMQLKSGKHDSNSLKSKVWTSSPIFDYFNINLNSTIANNDSVLATTIILRKSPESLSVIRKWLDVAEQKPDLFTDKYNDDSKLKNPEFKENRHDQSIFSIIVQIEPYNKYVKVIEEEIEGKCDIKMPICATRKRQGGGTRKKGFILSGGNSTIKLFNLDLHQSVIEDIKTLLKSIYDSKFEITNWSISNHNHQFGKPTADVKFINQSTWKDINMDMISKFQNEYDSLLSTYDGFIVSHTPVFAMLYEKYNKPIIIVNSCRYDQPFCWNKDTEMLNLFKESLKRMTLSKQLVIISNNKADQKYLKDHTGIDSIYIPSLCMYTNSKFNKSNSNYVLFEDRVKNNFKTIPNSSILVERPKNYTFEELFKYSGIVHMPYDISSMSLFEQYFAEMPLFFPSKKFYKECIKNKTVDFIVRYDKWGTTLPDEEIDSWLNNADYYNFKYINYYESFNDCINKINVFTDSDKDARIKHVNKIKTDALNQWRQIINSLFKVQS
jgi:hypothetical protein